MRFDLVPCPVSLFYSALAIQRGYVAGYTEDSLFGLYKRHTRQNCVIHLSKYKQFVEGSTPRNLEWRYHLAGPMALVSYQN